MARKYLDDNGLLYLWSKIKAAFVQKENGKGLSTNDYTTTEKNKLSGIASGAQVNVIETVKVNGTALTVSSKAVDVTVPSYSAATTSANGLMSSTDKAKLDGIDSGAEVNVIETVKVNGTALTVTSKAVDVTVPSYSAATTSANGLMSSTDKSKLDGIEASADVNVIETVKLNTTALTVTDKAVSIPVDSSLSSNSDNPIANSTVKTALDLKANAANAALTGTPTAPTAASGTSTTQIATTAFVMGAVADAVGGVTQIDYEVVSSLPSTGTTGKIYLVAHSHGTNDAYDEYIWLANSTSYEKIGHTDIDLSGYLQTTDVVSITNGEIDTIVAS